jgi:hypothetical protein
MNRRLILIGAVILSLISCDEKEDIPAYVRVEPFVVNAEGGAAWQKITDGWFYANGEFLGAYTLPAEIPVLASGEGDIIVFPGVKENGISTTPNIYAFLTRYDQDITFKPGETVTVTPTTAYDADIVIPFGTFERGSFDGFSSIVLSNRDEDDATGYQISTDGAFAGKSLLMQVDTAHTLMEVLTEKVPLPATFEREVWLEVNYRNDMPFTLWLVGSSNGGLEKVQPVFQFSDSPDWNKIYINLTEFLILMNEDEYGLLFRSDLPRDLNGNYTQTEGTVRIDNIRLVHF